MRLDSATEWGTLWRLALPLTRPAVVTVYNALTIWNGFLLPLILTQSPPVRQPARPDPASIAFAIPLSVLVLANFSTPPKDRHVPPRRANENFPGRQTEAGRR
jgi:ABC-type glycerol-3-phosphate transport system permease component